MKHNKNLYTPIIFLVIGLFIIYPINSNKTSIFTNKIKTNIQEGIKFIKISEEKVNINDKYISINAKIPQINYKKNNVERYINTYIRTNINAYINDKKQNNDIRNNNNKEIIDINYHIGYEDENLINIIIYKDTKYDKSNFYLEKDSYLFDLKTGQRIYINNFFKNNENYSTIIKDYILNNLNDKELKEFINKVNIDKNTNYYITDEGINIYFNPYKKSTINKEYEFNIPYKIFNNGINMVKTDYIVANIDTQTITNKNKYINSVINVPIIITNNKTIEKSINNRITNEIMSFYNKSKDEAENYLKDNPNNELKFIANTNFDVKKNSNNMLSIAVTYTKYSGGAHNEYENIGYNIYMPTGEFLNLSDIFKENVDYKSVINDEIRRQIEELIKQNPDNEQIYQFSTIKDNQKFYIQDDSLVIFFDLYDIAPYPAGIPEFKINIKTISHILKDEYIDIFQ